MNVRLRYARVVTPKFTYMKHQLIVNAGVVEVSHPRSNDVQASLDVAEITELGAKCYRIVGVDGTVWYVDDIGCGCRQRITVTATEPANVPT